MRFVFVVLVLLIAITLSSASLRADDVDKRNIVGAPTPVSPNDPEVVKAANFAAGAAFPNHTVSVVVVRATQQVVAGMKYDVIVEVTVDGDCQLRHFGVWNRFGTYKLMENDKMDGDCRMTHEFSH